MKKCSLCHGLGFFCQAAINGLFTERVEIMEWPRHSFGTSLLKVSALCFTVVYGTVLRCSITLKGLCCRESNQTDQVCKMISESVCVCVSVFVCEKDSE